MCLDYPVSPPPAPPSAPPSLPPPPSSPSPTPPPTHPLDINECLPFDDSSQTPEYCSCLRVLSGNQCNDKEFILNRTYGSEQGVPGEMAAEDRNSYVYWIDYAANRRICYTNVEENIEQNSQVKAGFFGCHANIYQPDSDHVYTSCQSGVYEHIPLDQVTFCSPPSPASPPPLPPPLVPTLPCFVGLPTSGTLSYSNEESVSVLPTVNSLGIDIIRGELGGGFTQAEAMGDTVVAVATDPVPTETSTAFEHRAHKRLHVLLVESVVPSATFVAHSQSVGIR